MKVIKGPPCEVCGKVGTATWIGAECQLEKEWVLRKGPQGVGAYCPEHASQGKRIEGVSKDQAS